LFPGLAVAQQLAAMQPTPRLTFVGSDKNLERRFIRRSGYDYLPLVGRPMGRSPWNAIRFLADQMAASRAAGRFLRRQRVSLVVGLGGYASVPMVRAAARAGVPIVLLEQNVVPGRATRWLAPGATLVCLGYAEAAQQLQANCPVRVTGIPLRAGFSETERSSTSSSGRGRRRRALVVLGGSQGARSLNEAVPRALYKLRDHLAGWTVVHQTGTSDVERTRRLYDKLALQAVVTPFIKNMPHVMSAAELAISRSGGTTLAELAAAEVPALLVPYPHAKDDHQRRNADRFARRGAARTVDPRMTPGRLDDQLAEELAGLLIDRHRRKLMSAAMRREARPDAAWSVSRMILDLVAMPSFRAA